MNKTSGVADWGTFRSLDNWQNTMVDNYINTLYDYNSKADVFVGLYMVTAWYMWCVRASVCVSMCVSLLARVCLRVSWRVWVLVRTLVCSCHDT